VARARQLSSALLVCCDDARSAVHPEITVCSAHSFTVQHLSSSIKCSAVTKRNIHCDAVCLMTFFHIRLTQHSTLRYGVTFCLILPDSFYDIFKLVVSTDPSQGICRSLGNRYYSVKNLLSSSLLSKKLKIKINRTIILPVVLYGCETWSLTLREESRLRVFENRVYRRIFGPKMDEVTREWRKLHNEELSDLYF